MKLKFISCLIFGITFLVSGCGPSESEQISTITQIAAGISATQTAQAPTAIPTPTLSPGDTRVSPADGMTMVYISPGEYTLGSTEEDVDWAVEQCEHAHSILLSYQDECDAAEFQDEMPQHTVWLDPYWIDQTEVTVAMFSQFVDATGYQTDAERLQYIDVTHTDKWGFELNADWSNPFGLESATGDLKDNPVVNVTWQDAWAYCEWADRRLPTEAEWEAAARGMELRIFPWGEETPKNELANLTDDRSLAASTMASMFNDGFARISPVMSFPGGASPFGVLGLAGNVKEWVYDWYSPAYDLPPLTENPVNTTETETRVRRGGSFDTYLSAIRTASRAGSSPYWTASDLGFRCAFSDLALPDPPERESTPPDLAFGDWRTAVYSRPSLLDTHGYLKSFAGLEITGQYNQCKYLKISTPDYSEGWLSTMDDIVFYKDCLDFEETFIRPVSASWNFSKGGLLILKNQGETSAYIVLKGNKTGKTYKINIGAGGQITMENIPDSTFEMIYIRPASASVSWEFTRGGTLSVKNQGETDTYLILVGIDTETKYEMYVRAGEQVTMENIPDGRYKVYITSGTIWVSYENRFKDAVSYKKLKEPMEFQRTWWELVLQTVEGGNTGSVPINESDFP